MNEISLLVCKETNFLFRCMRRCKGRKSLLYDTRANSTEVRRHMTHFRAVTTGKSVIRQSG